MTTFNLGSKAGSVLMNRGTLGKLLSLPESLFFICEWSDNYLPFTIVRFRNTASEHLVYLHPDYFSMNEMN